jgi:hypothetical protein
MIVSHRRVSSLTLAGVYVPSLSPLKLSQLESPANRFEKEDQVPTDEKDRLLESAGYLYRFDRMIFLNRDTRKIFSRSAVEDNSPEWLREKLSEQITDWAFYFNESPSPRIREAIIAEFSL